MTESLAVVLPVVVGVLVGLGMVLNHLKTTVSLVNEKRIDVLATDMDNHKNEMKLVVSALSDKLTQLANRRQ